MKVDFARQSDDGRITLVIVNGEDRTATRTLWAVMEPTEIAQAREALRKREKTRVEKPEHIGSWEAGNAPPQTIPNIADWAKAHGVDGVVWTALPPKFDKVERTPSEGEVVAYLGTLRGARRENAERYVRLTPRQIDTTYRRRIEAELGWTALDKWPW